MLIPASSKETPDLRLIHLYVPQTGISTELQARSRTFWTETVCHPPLTVLPSMRYASPAGENLPNSEFTKEDLGFHEMEGLPAPGIRESQTIPGESGTGREIVITDEYRYSEDLRVYLMITHGEPREGTVTLRVAQVTRTGPDPALFEIPEGYKPASAMRGTTQPRSLIQLIAIANHESKDGHRRRPQMSHGRLHPPLAFGSMPRVKSKGLRSTARLSSRQKHSPLVRILETNSTRSSLTR